MSDQREGSTTSLEEVFLSREFGQAPARRVLTDTRFEEVAPAAQLEEIFLSESFGRPLAVVPRRSQVVPLELVGRDDAVVIPLHPTRESTRYRAIAAVSGVAAAALVVAGVASGGGHAGRPTVSAQGERVSAQPRQASGGSSPAPLITSGAAPATTVAQNGSTAAAPSTNSGGPTGVAVSTASLVVEATPGVAPAPPPAGGSSSAGGTGGGGGSPAPTSPPAPTDPLAPVVSGVGSAVSGLGTTVTNTVNQLGNALPPIAPVTAVLGGAGTTLSSIGHALRTPRG